MTTLHFRNPKLKFSASISWQIGVLVRDEAANKIDYHRIRQALHLLLGRLPGRSVGICNSSDLYTEQSIEA